MRFFRYMSANELDKLMAGEELENTTIHRPDCKGFCFFNADDVDALPASEFLKGIVTREFLVYFSIADDYVHKNFKENSGYYRLYGGGAFAAQRLPEYCCTKYKRCDDVRVMDVFAVIAPLGIDTSHESEEDFRKWDKEENE